MSYFAIVITTHVNPINGAEEPRGVFDSREEAEEYLTECERDWAARGAGWYPHNGTVRINEYAARDAAENADPSDGFRRGNSIEGTSPLSTRSY